MVIASTYAPSGSIQDVNLPQTVNPETQPKAKRAPHNVSKHKKETKMRKLFLQTHHITDLYFAVDNLVTEPLKPSGGRPPALRQSEVITILIWNALTAPSRTLKQIYDNVEMYHLRDFPRLPKYTKFVEACHRTLPDLISVLKSLLVTTAPIRIMDSTMLPVC